MSRSKRDILDTEAMLSRLAQLLAQHREGQVPEAVTFQSRLDAESLRRISMTLHRWHELECNEDIQRGTKNLDGTIKPNDEGRPWIGRSDYAQRTYYARITDREAGARKRLAAILKRYPTLTAYVQTDPRGCALYILKPGDVPEGFDASSYYSRGLAVFQ